MVEETRARKWSACTRPVHYIYARCLKTFPLPSSFMCAVDKQTIEYQYFILLVAVQRKPIQCLFVMETVCGM